MATGWLREGDLPVTAVATAPSRFKGSFVKPPKGMSSLDLLSFKDFVYSFPWSVGSKKSSQNAETFECLIGTFVLGWSFVEFLCQLWV